MLSIVLFALTAFGALPNNWRYPEPEIKANFDLKNGWLCNCAFIAYLQNETNSKSIAETQQKVYQTINRYNTSEWEWLGLGTQIRDAIVEKILDPECERFKSKMWPPLHFHPWKPVLDATKAAPDNHHVLIQKEDSRMLNVYVEPLTHEQFHSHPYFSIFLHWGHKGGITDHAADGTITDIEEWDGVSGPTFEVSFAAPQWMHSVYQKPDSMDLMAANCPHDQAPPKDPSKRGFFMRLSFMYPRTELVDHKNYDPMNIKGYHWH